MATKDEVLTESDDIEVVEVDAAPGEEAKVAEADAAKKKEDEPVVEDDHDDPDDEHQEDARLAEKDQSPEEIEANKRKLGQRQRQKAARDRDRQELATLRAQNADFQRRLSSVESNTLSVNEGMVTSKLEEVRRDIATADAILADAVKNSDGDAYAAALRLRDEAKSQEGELIAAQKVFVEAKKAPAAPDAEATRLAGDWKRANAEWYGSNSTATASANAIDAALSAENLYAHNSPDYYRELTRRVSAHFNGGERTERKSETPADNKRKGPPIGDRGGAQNGNGTGRKVFLSKDRVDAIKAAGDWDDPKERAKAVKAYEEYDRDQSAQR